MLSFTATREQSKELRGLAYWIADIKHMRERYGEDEPELEVCDKTIRFIFDQLDKLGVPFWVQNSVVTYAEDWRRYTETYTDKWLSENRNIVLT